MTSTPGTEGIIGDADGNGFVDANDALAILKHAAKITSISNESYLKNADVDMDSNITASDSLLALNIAAKPAI